MFLTLFLAGFAASAQAVGIYTKNFESNVVGVEWTTNTGSLVVDTAPGGQKILGADDGLAEGLSNQNVTLALTGLGPHSSATISFDFIAIDSLDNVEPFTVAVDAGTVFGAITFINRISGPTGSSDPADTGTPISTDTHAFPPVNSLSRSDAVYRISFEVPHAAASIDVTFAMSGMQGILDESWSLDNIQIETAEVPPVPAMTWYGLLMMAVLIVGIGVWTKR